ncbi:anaphase-promoting complex subunit Cut9 [Coemansia sp. RSA 2320]|nr:anaphase-promoting complex subunit Cut9 [Coemansia sp. RSA 2320]
MADSSEVVAHLRVLRADCAKGLAWCSALVWAEKSFMLSDDIEDLLWLVDALVTNGQYRQAEEWLVNPLYSAKCLASTTGRYLASVIAMRLGRAEDALDVLSADLTQTNGAPGSRREGTLPTRLCATQTPTAARTLGGSLAPRSLLDEMPIITKNSRQDKRSRDSTWIPNEATANDGARPLDPRAWMLYMQGAAVVQLSNVGGSESTPSIKSLCLRYPEAKLGPELPSISLGFTPADARHGPGTATRGGTEPLTTLGGMGSLVTSIWVEAIRTDARCWEAWSGIREHGLLTCDEELRLVASLDWAAYCGGSHTVGQFFKDYCLATLTTFSLSNAVIEATDRLLSKYPRLTGDPALRAIQAARLLSLGRARACLEYTVSSLEYRRIPDPNTVAIHVTALTVLYAKDALFRIAHELADEFGISSIKRAEIEPSDTRSALALSAGAGSGASATKHNSVPSLLYGTPSSAPRTASLGSAAAGTGRVRAGARGLLVPETPTRPGFGLAFAGGNGSASAVRRPTAASGSFAVTARAVVQSASAAATAAWRGLWGLPTWTQPGPPVLATYPCALGPAQASAVNAEAAISTLGTFTTTNTQSVGSPTQYEFIGASIAWYAIGCYYLVSAALQAFPDISQHEWALSGLLYGSSLAAATAGHSAQAGREGTIAALRHNQPLSPEAEHALAEARRWLAKTTLASPRSIVAWVAFAHTFIVAGEWESATRALHTAIGLCGCEDVVHGGGRDPTPMPVPQQTPKSGMPSLENEQGPAAAARLERDSVDNASVLEWCSSGKRDSDINDPVRQSSMADPQLLNDIGVLYYNKGQLAVAQVFFTLALAALNANFGMQHRLRSAFNPGSNKNRRQPSPELQAYNALYKVNLGNTLRKLGDYDSALACLQAAAAHAPTSTDILLSEAFALHLCAIERYSESEQDSLRNLDKAIDTYHSILASLPGDSVTTDLLTLALDLSANIQNLSLLGGDLDIENDLEVPLHAFGLGDQDDADLLSPSNRAHSYGSPPSGAVSNQSLAQQSDAAVSSESASGEDESDEAMEIEDESGSESDMAMD